eukprot:Platyproteum_vivax@DN1971_c0_g1_i1.p1
MKEQSYFLLGEKPGNMNALDCDDEYRCLVHNDNIPAHVKVSQGFRHLENYNFNSGYQDLQDSLLGPLPPPPPPPPLPPPLPRLSFPTPYDYDSNFNLRSYPSSPDYQKPTYQKFNYNSMNSNHGFSNSQFQNFPVTPTPIRNLWEFLARKTRICMFEAFLHLRHFTNFATQKKQDEDILVANIKSARVQVERAIMLAESYMPPSPLTPPTKSIDLHADTDYPNGNGSVVGAEGVNTLYSRHVESTVQVLNTWLALYKRKILRQTWLQLHGDYRRMSPLASIQEEDKTEEKTSSEKAAENDKSIPDEKPIGLEKKKEDKKDTKADKEKAAKELAAKKAEEN